MSPIGPIGPIRLIRLLPLVLLLTLAACGDDNENVFGERAANRVERNLNEYYSVLEGQSQGWAMDYYPADRSLGGVAYTAVFKNGEVSMQCAQSITNTVTSTTYPIGTSVSSYYRILGETGIVLSFDTYNALFHYWSQPFSGKAKGYQSDYEFTFLTASADSVVLVGKKYQNVLKLYPLKQSATDYVQGVDATGSILRNITRKRAVIDGNSQPITMTESQFTYQVDGQSHTMSYIFTPQGIRFYRTACPAGVPVDQMSFDATTLELRSADGRVVLPAPSATESFAGTKTQWYLCYTPAGGATDMCADLQTVIGDIVKIFKKRDWGYEVLTDLYIGINLLPADKDTHRMIIGLNAKDNYGKGGNTFFGYGIAMDVVDNSRQLISITLTEAGTSFDKHVFCQPFVDFIAQHSPYVLTFDSQDAPTEVTLTSEKDATKWFKVKLR